MLYNAKEFKELYELPIVYYDNDGWMCVENWFFAINFNNKNEMRKTLFYIELYNYVEKIVNSDIENKIKEKYVYLKNHFDSI